MMRTQIQSTVVFILQFLSLSHKNDSFCHSDYNKNHKKIIVKCKLSFYFQGIEKDYALYAVFNGASMIKDSSTRYKFEVSIGKYEK